MVEVHGFRHGVVQRVLPLSFGGDVGVLGDGDPGPVGQLTDGLHEVQVLDVAEKADGVARPLTPEAVVETLFGVHAERRGFLLMKWTQPDPPPPLALQRRVFTDESDDVGGSPDPGHVLLRYGHDSDATGRVPRPTRARRSPG